MNTYEKYITGVLDDDIQKKVENFSLQGKDMAEKMFRAGFMAGILILKTKRNVRIYKINHGEKKE